MSLLNRNIIILTINMGKNPGAKKLKQKYKGTERQFDTNYEDLEEEASKKGVEVWQLKKKGKNSDSEDEDDEENSSDEESQVAAAERLRKDLKKSDDEDEKQEEIKVVDYDKKFGIKQ